MSDVGAMLREYIEILDMERELAARKEKLRAALLSELVEADENCRTTADGTVQRRKRFTLKPRKDEALTLLTSEDLFAFTNFTTTKVKNLLVPIYGRDRLLPIFEITEHEQLIIKRPGATESLGLS